MAVSGGDFPFQITIGGADYTRFRPRIFFRADAAEFSILQYLQELGLEPQAEFADFIEKSVPLSASDIKPAPGGDRAR